jgi:hypothetical protein
MPLAACRFDPENCVPLRQRKDLYRAIKDVAGMDIAAIRRLSDAEAADVLDRLQNPRRTTPGAARQVNRAQPRAPLTAQGQPRRVERHDRRWHT